MLTKNAVQKHRLIPIMPIISTTACILLILLFLSLNLNVKNIMEQLQTEAAILAFIDDAYSDAEAMEVESIIMSLDNIKSATYISRENACENYIEKYGNTNSQSRLTATVFRSRYSIHIIDVEHLTETVQALKDIRGIVDIRVDEAILHGFAAINRSFKFLCVGLATLLLFITLSLLAVTIKLTTISQQKEASNMIKMGINIRDIRASFLAEWFMIILFGVFSSFVLALLSYTVFYLGLRNTGILSYIEILPFSELARTLLLADILLGLIVLFTGYCSSANAVLKMDG